MDYTQNLNLPQFEETDRIHHDDFNDAFAKLDTLPRIATGTYTGDGTAERTINLGFTPKAVLVVECDGLMSLRSTNTTARGGLALQEYPCESTNNDQVTYIEIVEGGFKIYSYTSGYWLSHLNENGVRFHYLAIA